jgi:hypothetical protein
MKYSSFWAIYIYRKSVFFFFLVLCIQVISILKGHKFCDMEQSPLPERVYIEEAKTVIFPGPASSSTGWDSSLNLEDAYDYVI